MHVHLPVQMKAAIFFLLALGLYTCPAQDNSLDYFISLAIRNAPELRENENLMRIGDLEADLIKAQQNAIKVDAASEVLVAPYFNHNGNFVSVTTSPSPNAYGYDVGITNGGLYSAQLSITKNLFNSILTDDLLFRNQIKNEAQLLTAEEFRHTLEKKITEAYILAFQFQLQEEFNRDLVSDLAIRIQVVELLVKRGVLQESDYLLLKLDKENRELELLQILASRGSAFKELQNLSGNPNDSIRSLLEPQLQLSGNTRERFIERRFANDSIQVAADQKVFEDQYRPQIMAYGNTGLNAVELNNIYHRVGMSAGLKVTIPLYDGNQKKFNALQAALKSDNLEYYRDNSEIQLQNNLADLNHQIAVQKATLESLEKQLKQLRGLLEIYKGKLVNGQVTVIDYLNIIQNYKMMSYTNLQARTNLWLLTNQYNSLNW